MKKWSHLQDIELPKLDGKSVALLIGNDVPEAHWTFEQRRGRRKQPYAARTLLGWTLIGPIGEAGGPVRSSVNFISGDQEAISAQLKHMYEADFVESTPHGPALPVGSSLAL